VYNTHLIFHSNHDDWWHGCLLFSMGKTINGCHGTVSFLVRTMENAVLALQPPQFGTHYPLASVVLLLQTLSIASLKLTASSRPTAPPSGSAKCLRFGHWLTLCTLNMHILTYLFAIASNVSVFTAIMLFN